MFTFLAKETTSIVNNSQLHSDHFCFSFLTKLGFFFFLDEALCSMVVSDKLYNLIKVIA